MVLIKSHLIHIFDFILIKYINEKELYDIYTLYLLELVQNVKRK